MAHMQPQTELSPSTCSIRSDAFHFTKAAYTIKEALEILPFGRTYLWELICSGEIPVMRFGKRVAIAASDLEALLNKRRAPLASLREAR